MPSITPVTVESVPTRTSASGAVDGDHTATLEEARQATEKVGALNAQVRGLNEDIDRLRNVVATDVRNETELAQRLVEADQARVSAEVTLDGAQSLFGTAQSDANISAARAEALQLALDANSTSSAALRDVEGALGSLGDLIEIDAEKRVAVQVALGDALSAVVARNIDAARRALQELRQSGSVGKGSFDSLTPSKILLFFTYK